ncbi:P-loop containing nucleoside triphosphate hydrolase protein [Syncephalastrum racemosum]|uniref:RNA helicase n=1 Tax=Syncephalastrum racemosum TaxID=13706 RepID=A0A1X2H5Y0_SYNRA|nr:P-loop containing nucleoside triphosphate hydrolase protein [Syncephalastrum racemosum]
MGLPPPLVQALYKVYDRRPSQLQRIAIPLIMDPPYRDLIAQAQTGTGKTTAFIIASLARINPHLPSTQAIIVVPTRELAIQIFDCFTRLIGRVEGHAIHMYHCIKNAKRERTHAHVVVGTPGALEDRLRRKLIDVSSVQVFILDEADVMLDFSGMQDLSLRIHKFMPSTAQFLLFSATFPERVRQFASMICKHAPHHISLTEGNEHVQQLRQFFVRTPDIREKAQFAVNVHDLLGGGGNTLIFCRRRDEADALAQELYEANYQIATIHGTCTVQERDRIMDLFRRGEIKVLITTNLLARGIDVVQIYLVINYNLPVDMDGNVDANTYLHRIGRSARFNREGRAISFVDGPQDLQHVHELQERFGATIKEISSDLEQMETDIR